MLVRDTGLQFSGFSLFLLLIMISDLFHSHGICPAFSEHLITFLSGLLDSCLQFFKIKTDNPSSPTAFLISVFLAFWCNLFFHLHHLHPILTDRSLRWFSSLFLCTTISNIKIYQLVFHIVCSHISVVLFLLCVLTSSSCIYTIVWVLSTFVSYVSHMFALCFLSLHTFHFSLICNTSCLP